MGRCLIRQASRLATAVLVLSALTARAETVSLQLKKIEGNLDRMRAPAGDQMFRGLYPQQFFRQTGLEQPFRQEQDHEAEFAQVITKEPPAYKSKQPFRAVAKLGTQRFGFVLDSDQPAEEPKPPAADEEPLLPADAADQLPSSPRYNRLLFDLNANGDLTDETAIEALPQVGMGYPRSYTPFSFPRVDLTLDVGGTPVDFAFAISGYSNAQYLTEQQLYQYTNVSLNSAAYREGELTLDGRKLKIVVTDFNSNGRFDDVSVIDANVQGAGGTLYPQYGDMIFIDPDAESGGYRFGYDPTAGDAQHPLAKLLCLGDRFYDLHITPAGDTLTLTPSPTAIGHVSNANQGYRALVYNDQMLLKVQGNAEGRAPLPVGSWRLLSYTLDRTGSETDTPQAGAEPSLFQALANAVLPGSRMQGPQLTLISARAKGDYPAFTVREGESAEMLFGPPYKPVVSGNFVQGGMLSLGMDIVGAGGEVCDNLLVNGGRPGKPSFTITTPDGETVAQGSFEYG